MFKKVIISALAVFVVVSVSSAAQINLMTDTINFRTSSDQAKISTHNGALNVNSNGSGSGIYSTITGGTGGQYAVRGRNIVVVGNGFGGNFEGGNTGVSGKAIMPGTGFRYGGWFDAMSGNYSYGIYARAASGTTTNWAGYFSGNVYTTGTYQSSDASLKRDVTSMDSAVAKLMKLSPKIYYYDTEKYSKLNLPRQKQNGLIAQEVELVFPEIVSTAVEPIVEIKDGKTIETTESFKCVNYTALIPVLIKAMQEQQIQIVALENEVNALKK